MHFIRLILLVPMLPLLACGNQQGRPSSDFRDGPVAKVRVYQDGRLTLDGREVSLEQLKVSFASLSGAGGSVLYYREAPEGDPPPMAMDVVRAIAEARLPVSMSTKEDFSDVLLPDGSTVPRE